MKQPLKVVFKKIRGRIVPIIQKDNRAVMLEKQAYGEMVYDKLADIRRIRLGMKGYVMVPKIQRAWAKKFLDARKSGKDLGKELSRYFPKRRK